MSVNDDIFQERWKMSFPPKELDIRIMCGDPQAVAWMHIEQWLNEQNFTPKVTMPDLVHCLWYAQYGDTLTQFDIYRGTMSLPGSMPPELDKWVLALFE
jgi:hypothetical protein